MTILPTGQPLVGRHVVLRLLTDDDVPELWPLLADPVVYGAGYVMHRSPVSLEDGRALINERFLAGQGKADGKGVGRNAYAIRLVRDSELGAAGTLVGTSSLMEASLHNEGIHLGSTFYGSPWWGTQVNPEAKLLLLSNCFDECGYHRVKIQTDLLNTRSQAAIAKLGAQREGVLRHEQKRDDGTWRDTVVYSVLKEEWPGVKSGLEARLR